MMGAAKCPHLPAPAREHGGSELSGQDCLPGRRRQRVLWPILGETPTRGLAQLAWQRPNPADGSITAYRLQHARLHTSEPRIGPGKRQRVGPNVKDHWWLWNDSEIATDASICDLNVLSIHCLHYASTVHIR